MSSSLQKTLNLHITNSFLTEIHWRQYFDPVYELGPANLHFQYYKSQQFIWKKERQKVAAYTMDNIL